MVNCIKCGTVLEEVDPNPDRVNFECKRCKKQYTLKDVNRQGVVMRR